MVIHYKRFFSKKEVFFVKNKNFYVNSPPEQDRKPEPREKLRCRIDPKFPERAKESGKKPCIECKAHDASRCHIRTKAAASDSHGKGKNEKGGKRTEKHVKCRCQHAPLLPAAQTNHAQKIIHQCAQAAKEDRFSYVEELCKDIVSHRSYRKMRERRPPRGDSFT